VKKVVLSTVVSLFIIISLVLASCGQGAATSSQPTTGATSSPPTTTSPTTTSTSTAPRYGGVLSIALGGDISTFDEAVAGMHAGATTLHLTNEEVLTGDWAKGPAGTGETTWATTAIDLIPLKTGSLAESWELPEVGTMIVHVRQGVHYSLDPSNEASRLVNGRELDAEDIAFSLNRNISSTVPGVPYRVGGTGQATITAPDKWTVVIKLPPSLFVEVTKLCDYMSVRPPEVVQKYGHMNDWKLAVGTGPFILKDYVSASSATLVKNLNYWGKDPVGPGKGNPIPYVDGVKLMIITDASTRLSAIRTAKIDVIHDIAWEDASSLKNTTPDLVFEKYSVGNGNVIYMRTDKPDLPFKDVRVRRALMMATDFETIKNTWAGGDAQILTWPIPYFKEYKDAYLSLEEATPSIQELYKYSLDTARSLLAEAGLPQGFKTKIICANISDIVDYLSIVKEMWAEVGVELTLDQREGAVAASISRTRTYDELMFAAGSPIGSVFIGNSLGGQIAANGSYINIPAYEEARNQMRLLAVTDPAEAARIHKELMKDVLDKAWAIPTVYAPMYHFWWPWLKNYHGELSMGYDNRNAFAKYIWIDPDLKRSMKG
jgi:peptide/nickel transport system substrate-binding protein